MAGLPRWGKVVVILALLVAAAGWWLSTAILGTNLTNRAVLMRGKVVIFPICVDSLAFTSQERFPVEGTRPGSHRC